VEIKMIISICIGTFDRRELLAYCLDSLSRLIDPRPEHDIEIIVVDNNSSDGTRQLVERLIPSFPFKLRYVFEAEQGISAARNRAIKEAVGDYLAFLDDECVVDRNWLSTAIADIKEFRPSLIGGPYFGAFLPGNRPKWFKTEYGDAHFIGRHYPRGFQSGFRASSGNMFIRRDVFESVTFDVAMGPKGNQLKIGEETDLQERFLHDHDSEQIFYDPKMIVRHFIRPEKMRLVYQARRAIATELGSKKFVENGAFLTALAMVSVHAALAPIMCACRDRKKYPYWQNFVYEHLIPATCYRIGAILKYVRGHVFLQRR
jgi:glycosyltransferase involved in cell wall biosynthesis